VSQSRHRLVSTRNRLAIHDPRSGTTAGGRSGEAGFGLPPAGNHWPSGVVGGIVRVSTGSTEGTTSVFCVPASQPSCVDRTSSTLGTGARGGSCAPLNSGAGSSSVRCTESEPCSTPASRPFPDSVCCADSGVGLLAGVLQGDGLLSTQAGSWALAIGSGGGETVLHPAADTRPAAHSAVKRRSNIIRHSPRRTRLCQT
jgi:hypothetical protein